jgi:hypothetical protein
MALPECLKLCGSRLINRAEATSSYGSRTRHSPTAVEVADLAHSGQSVHGEIDPDRRRDDQGNHNKRRCAKVLQQQ